ncbi:MAG: SDR family oxidoreductase [Bernardetiaceae bacterium]|nr:SDR family oxidoreductase [Bernardetiaceae bacterium]
MTFMLVITGGTKGIGRAIIEKFAQQGYDIFTCARNQDDLKMLKQEVESQYQVSLEYEVADLSQASERSAFAKAVKATHKPVGILINNTGVFRPGTIQEEEEGTLELLIQTNLYSAYHLTRALLPDMVARKKGHIFNICSTASFMAYTNGGSYCISKFALYGMSKVLRAELKDKNIRVTSVLPGATFTASWEGADIPQERFMPSEDIAECVWTAFALSDRTVIEDLVLRPQLGDL